jgi:hypothetical protein
MATDKTFTVAGVSKLKGEYKIRFANDVMRVKNLAKSGHEDIRLVELDEAMLKTDAAKFIQTLPEFEDVDAQTAISEYLTKHDKQPKTAVKKATVKVKPAQAPKVKAPAVDTANMEDAPF